MKRILILVLIVLTVGGVSVAWDAVCIFALAFFQTFVAILPFLDLEQTLLCKIITIAIVQVLCVTGFIISHKAKSKAGKVISGVVDTVLTALLFIA